MAGFQNFLIKARSNRGMEMEPVHIKMSRDMRIVLQQMARQDDVSPGQLLRTLVSREIARRFRARPPVRADERLVAPLRARLAPDLAEARDWQDLQDRLRGKGYELREAGGGLALYQVRGGRVCKASELGFSYSRLLRRFRAPFPGHAHGWLAERLLGEPEGTEDPDFDVIEPDQAI